MPVFEKIQKLQSTVRSLKANAEGQTGAAKYPYISGAKLLSFVRPAMDDLKLLLFPEVTDITNTPVTYYNSKGEKTEMFTTLRLRFTWVDSEDGSQFSQNFAANGMNSWDKGLGSALTYAERYYLMKTLHIATDEDDVDALNREEVEKPVAKPAKKATVKAQEPVKAAQALAPAAPAKKIFSTAETPTAWSSAIVKFANGELCRADIEKKYTVTEENWKVFMEVVAFQKDLNADDNKEF